MRSQRPWHASLELDPTTLWLWLCDRDGQSLLQAALPRGPEHPRALSTMLEGLALWSGSPLSAVLGVDEPLPASLGLGPLGALEHERNALVQILVRRPARPRRQLGRRAVRRRGVDEQTLSLFGGRR